jgi:hypothetical protein
MNQKDTGRGVGAGSSPQIVDYAVRKEAMMCESHSDHILVLDVFDLSSDVFNRIAAMEAELCSQITDTIQEFFGMAVRTMINPAAAYTTYAGRVNGFEDMIRFVNKNTATIELVFSKCAFTVGYDNYGKMVLSEFSLKQ